MFASKKYTWIAFISGIVVILFYGLYRDKIELIYDSAWYCGIADGVIDAAGIHIEKFPKTFRGALLPIYLQFLNLSPLGIYTGWIITMAILGSSLFSVLLPGVITDEGINNCKRTIGCIVSIIIYIYVWGDLIVYPLSDFFAFFFIATSVYFAKRLINGHTMNLLEISFTAFLVGVSSYIAYNTRAAYLYGILILVLFVICCKIREKRYKETIVIAFACILGSFLIATPQCLINYNCEGVYSWRIYTENFDSSSSNNLQMQQVTWGIHFPRYETYVGAPEGYPSPGIYFKDATGDRIIECENISPDSFSIQKWFGIVLRHPLDMISIYTRHLINAMTPLWTELYIREINTNKIPVILLSFVIWFVCSVSILQRILSKNVNGKSMLLAGALYVPAALQIIGAVETRFFLPIYLLAYSYFALGVDYKKIWKDVKERGILYIVLFILILFMWICIISSTLASNVERTLLINDKFIYHK